ncbi:hypothetical protein FACS1894211_07980 [Clostridia bacterium]|nr:hypothetical protein FACS1894211_07980 [Clostridia bacterium]
MARKKVNAVKTDNLFYGRNVVRNIIALAAKEIGGVASLQGRGIRAELFGKNINVDVYLIIEFDYSMPDVAYRVQENIKRSVETMTEYKIDTVNVNVLGVRFPGAEAS